MIIDPGKSAEYLLAHRCLQYGHMVCWPSSQHVPYDVLVDNTRTIYKVQVKACRSKAKGNDTYSVRLKKGVSGEKYQDGDFDLLAAYVYETHTWYIIPYSVVRGKTGITLYPHRLTEQVGQYENFKEAWHLLKE